MRNVKGKMSVRVRLLERMIEHTTRNKVVVQAWDEVVDQVWNQAWEEVVDQLQSQVKENIKL